MRLMSVLFPGDTIYELKFISNTFQCHQCVSLELEKQRKAHSMAEVHAVHVLELGLMEVCLMLFSGTCLSSVVRIDKNERLAQKDLRVNGADLAC